MTEQPTATHVQDAQDLDVEEDFTQPNTPEPTTDELPDFSTSSFVSTEAEQPLLPSTHPSKPHLPTRKVFFLGTLWLGYQYYWILVSIIIAPSQVREIAGDAHKGRALALINLISGAVNLFLALLVGALNDRYGSPLGKRKPWISVGIVCMCISLLTLSGRDPLWFYAIGYACLTASNVVASVPFNGLVADITPLEQKGRVSSVLGSMNLFGYLLGAMTGVIADRIGIAGLYATMIAIVLTTAAVTIIGVQEPEQNLLVQETSESLDLWPLMVATVQPLFRHRDFRLVFISRFVFQLGIATVQQFLQYWIEDCVDIGSTPPKQAVSLALLPLLTLSPLAALLIPSQTRKRTVYTAASLMILTCLLMMLVKSFASAILCSALFGLGYGPFISVEFAMLMDVLPRGEDAARDMSLWHAALVLPQIVATPLAGAVRDLVQPFSAAVGVECLGYKVIFGVCVTYFVGGVLVTRRIDGIR